MQVQLIINSVDFSRWIKEGGLQFGETYRQSRDVTTLDGTLYRTQIIKTTISVELVELRGNTLAQLKTGLTVNPATVQATTTDGQTVTGLYYISNLSTSAKTVRGGNTYYSGTSFELEER